MMDGTISGESEISVLQKCTLGGIQLRDLVNVMSDGGSTLGGAKTHFTQTSQV